MNATNHVSDYFTFTPLSLFTFASERTTRRRCGKHTYRTKRDALTARNAAFQRRRHRPEYLRAYACEHCCGWHLTHLLPIEER